MIIAIFLSFHNGMVGEEYLCTKDCGGNVFDDMTSEEIEAANERNRKMVFGRIFGAIRHNLDSLMVFSEESYHFESHHHGTDTIKYSLCLKNSEDTVRKYKADDGSMIYPDAMETVFFDFTAGRKPCGKHSRGFGTLEYNKNNLRDYYLRHGRPMHSSFTVRKTGMLMPDELMPIPYDYNI